MTLRVPVVEVHDIAAAEWLRMINVRRLIARSFAERFLPLFFARQIIRVAVGVGRFVPDQFHERLRRAAFHFEHHRFFERAEPLVNEKKRNEDRRDRKSTRLNSSHGYISYAVFCLKKKKKKN